MDNSSNFFLTLVAAGLFGKNIKLSQFADANWQDMYRLAYEQSVLGLVLVGLEYSDIKPPQDLLLQWIGEVQLIEQRNNMLDKELVEFASICAENDYEYMVVKGSTVGYLYPKPEWRQAGDIDFLVHGEGNLVQKYSRVLSVEIQNVVEKEVGFDRNDVRYELHISLRTWAKKKHQQVWDELIEKEWLSNYYVEINSMKIRTLSPTVNSAYIFIHLFFHFIREGVSLRQFSDWAVVLHHYRDEIDREKLLQILLDLNVYEACCAFETILVDKLGLPLRELPLPIGNDDRKWQQKILKDIFRGGNFGMLNHHAHSSWKYKVETMRIALRNSFRYYRLCPSEVGGLIPRLVKGNLKVLLKQ